jgi:photosystem II stability/assembly factor-like uncharacterized protein
MTYLPKSELVGVLSPSSINTKDIGVNWINLGISTAQPINTEIYLGSGIVLGADSAGNLYRSTDYGNTWFTTVTLLGGGTNSITYLGSGILIICNTSAGGTIFRSRDFGATVGTVFVPAIIPLASTYAGNGIAIISSQSSGGGGHIFRSTDSGATWVDGGVISVAGTPAGHINTVLYLENGITIFGDSNGNIFRSTDSGATWSTITNITGAEVSGLVYLGNGISLAGTNDGHIFRSANFGISWTDVGLVLVAGNMSQFAYLGNGIILTSNGNNPGRIFRSTDNGLTWTLVLSNIISFKGLVYLDNGSVMTNNIFTVFRSDISYKTNESEVLIDPSIITTTTSMTVGQSHNTVNVDASGGSVNITLSPPSVLQKGHEFVIKKIDSSINTVVVIPDLSTIDGVSTHTLSTQWQSLTVRTNGGLWFTVSDIINNGPPGQLTPAITRYSMPGWSPITVTASFTATGGVIYYLPFFVANTTTFNDISVATSSLNTVTIDCRCYAWNNGVPGAQIANIGTFSWAVAFGTRTIVINLTLQRGFYFMAFRPSGNVINILAVTGGAPVYTMPPNNNFGAGAFINYSTLFVSAALADPAPAPTGLDNNNIHFIMNENP